MLKHIAFLHKNVYIYEYFLKKGFKFIYACFNDNVTVSRHSFKKFNKFLSTTLMWHWIRIAFKGKGYRMRKFQKSIKLTLNFGHSHWAKVGFDGHYFWIRKMRRQNYMCIIKGYKNLRGAKLELKYIRRLNKYTKRGLRLRKQFLQRRFGKISQVVSSLH
jgi:hypothetical protein